MYVRIGSTDYTSIRNLDFAPAVNTMADTLPINEFAVEIETDDDIAVGQYAYLYDDLDNLQAKYWIVYAERLTTQTVTVRAQSDLYILDQIKLEPVMWLQGETVSDILEYNIFIDSHLNYDLHSSFDQLLLFGYCPEQTARERLQWVCFCAGAYVKTTGNTRMEILPLDTSATLVPLAETFWRPAVTYQDYVTEISVTAYDYTQGTPSATDKWVTDGTDYYIVSEQKMTLANPYAPSGVPSKTLSYDGIYLVDNSVAPSILSYLGAMYFDRRVIDLDCINNAAYAPGDLVRVYLDSETMAEGVVESCVYRYGKQTRSTLHLTACEDVDAEMLAITYYIGALTLRREEYLLPVGYAYEIDTVYIDMTQGAHRYIYRPLTDSVTGTMVSGGVTETVECAVALHYYIDTGVLEIISVDEVTDDGEGVITIT